MAHSDIAYALAMSVSGVGGVYSRLVNLPIDNPRGDQCVDAQNASHDNRNDTAHHHVWAHHTHGRDADCRLGGSVGGAEVGETMAEVTLMNPKKAEEGSQGAMLRVV